MSPGPSRVSMGPRENAKRADGSTVVSSERSRQPCPGGACRGQAPPSQSSVPTLAAVDDQGHALRKGCSISPPYNEASFSYRPSVASLHACSKGASPCRAPGRGEAGDRRSRQRGGPAGGRARPPAVRRGGGSRRSWPASCGWMADRGRRAGRRAAGGGRDRRGRRARRAGGAASPAASSGTCSVPRHPLSERDPGTAWSPPSARAPTGPWSRRTGTTTSTCTCPGPRKGLGLPRGVGPRSNGQGGRRGDPRAVGDG